LIIRIYVSKCAEILREEFLPRWSVTASQNSSEVMEGPDIASWEICVCFRYNK